MDQSVAVALISAGGATVTTALGLLATRKYGGALRRAEKAEAERKALADRQARLDTTNDKLIDTLQEEIARRDRMIAERDKEIGALRRRRT